MGLDVPDMLASGRFDPKGACCEFVEEGVTERTEAAETERTEALLRSMLAGLGMIFDGVLLFDDEYRILASNMPAALALGLDAPEALVGRSLDEMARAVGLPALSPLVSGPGGLERELRIEQPEKGPRFLELRARRKAEQPLHWMAIRDTTERHRRVRGEATYAAITTVLVESATLADALPKLLGALGSALEWSVAELFRVDREANRLRWQAGWSAPAKGRLQVLDDVCLDCAFAPGEGTLGRAWSSGSPVWLDEIASDPTLACRSVMLRAGLVSALAFPVSVGGEIVGVLAFFSDEQRSCDPSVLRLLKGLDALIGQFLERMRLYEVEQTLRRKGELVTDRLKILQGVTSDLATATTIDEACRIVLSASIQALEADSAVLYLLDATGSQLILRESINYAQAANPKHRRFGLDAPGPLAHAVREKRPIYITTSEDLSRVYPLLADDVGPSFQTWVALPLVAHGEAMGGVGLTFSEPKDFPPDDRALLETFAWQCAVALDRARLFEAERIGKEQAESERARFRSILMNAPLPVVVYEGPNHVIGMANPAWIAMLEGLGEKDVLGKPLREAYTTLREAAEQIGQDLDRIHRTGEPLVFDEYPLALPRPDGSVEMRYYSASAQPIRDEGGGVRAVVQMSLDVTEQVRARQKQEEARAEAEAETRAKDEFLAILSHELRTPLQSMLGWTNMLLSRPYDPELTRRGIETLERNTKQQAKLIEQLLDVSRIVAGKILLDRHPLDLAGLVETAADSLRTQAAEKGVELASSCSQGAEVFGDPDRLRQVLMNLLSNALKFTPEGGRITVTLERDASHARIQVRDTGRGIPPVLLAHIFDPFRQVDTASRRVHGGLGLGLAIVKHLVEQHGGQVRAESEGEGLGATFTVTLPLFLRREQLPPKLEIPSEPSISLADLRVLVIDDDPDASEVAAMALRERGAEVTIAYSAREAIERFWESRHDVLVSEIALEGDDGYEMLRKIREIDGSLRKHTAAVALTAHARAIDRERAFAAGFDGFLAKPAAPADLVREVAAAVERRSE